MALSPDISQVRDGVWEIPADYKSGMRVPARICATRALLDGMEEGVFEQITNVATLPGIVKYACCMPDGHWGYGFPIGGVAAMDPDQGVISPGGIGFDINCGMRLVRTDLTIDDVKPRLHRLVDRLFERIPAGVGRTGILQLPDKQFCELLEKGARWCVEHGYGWPEDLKRTEDGGCMKEADASKVSRKAIERGRNQVGTLGSGNHYLELQVVRRENIVDPAVASEWGVGTPGQVVLMVHCGSRGFGHQVASDYLGTFLKVMGKEYGLDVCDKQLACAPFASKHGQDYFAAMACAVNMAFANRQVIMHRLREVFAEVFGKSARDLGMDLVYDVTHNTAKLETQKIDGHERRILIHRKGATRAFPPGASELPGMYRESGQPVIIGGSMETGSYLLAGVETGAHTFYTTAHGSGRVMSRRKAKQQFRGTELRRSMAEHGIYVHAASMSALAEEAGGAYKNIDDVVEAARKSGISRPIVRFVPIGNVKG
ncbi:MAG: RtcB family protein [Candidatus Pacebacteria bacterium]|nr:RtcB family protein [Candidatus Paceibacterota bacterium]